MSSNSDKVEQARSAVVEAAQKAGAAATELGSKVGEMTAGLFGRLRTAVREATEDRGETESDRLIKEWAAADLAFSAQITRLAKVAEPEFVAEAAKAELSKTKLRLDQAAKALRDRAAALG